jgi:hypothetical protein
MNQLEQTTEYSIYINAKCEKVNYDSANSITSNLLNKSDYFTKKEVSNRAIWPEKRLKGVNYSDDVKDSDASITIDSVNLSAEGFDGIKHLHNKLHNLTNNTDISIPPMINFNVSSIRIEPVDNERAITYDITKCNRKTELGCKHIYDDNIGIISEFKQTTSIHFRSDTDLQETGEYLDNCIRDNLFYFTKNSELEKYQNLVD